MPKDVVPLKCPPPALDVLDCKFTDFAALDGAPEWLVAGVWLHCGEANFVATGSVEVLADGYLARPLVIDVPSRIASDIEEAIPDIQGRLMSRASHLRLPETVSPPASPTALKQWPGMPYAMTVLLRVAESALLRHRIGCGLLFSSEAGRRLVVGTDKSTLAMVLSEDEDLIDRYCSDCEEVSVAEYGKLVGR